MSEWVSGLHSRKSDEERSAHLLRCLSLGQQQVCSVCSSLGWDQGLVTAPSPVSSGMKWRQVEVAPFPGCFIIHCCSPFTPPTTLKLTPSLPTLNHLFCRNTFTLGALTHKVTDIITGPRIRPNTFETEILHTWRVAWITYQLGKKENCGPPVSWNETKYRWRAKWKETG